MAEMQRLPLQATSLDEFHAKNIKDFVGWLQLSDDRQHLKLREFLLWKFSLDPAYQVLVPLPGAKRRARNNAQWHGFRLIEKDMKLLVTDVMRAYAQAMVMDQ